MAEYVRVPVLVTRSHVMWAWWEKWRTWRRHVTCRTTLLKTHFCDAGPLFLRQESCTCSVKWFLGLYDGPTRVGGSERIRGKGFRPLQHGPITPLPLPGTGYASVGLLGLPGNFSILRHRLTGACPSSQPPPPKQATWGHRRRPRLTWARPPVEPAR